MSWWLSKHVQKYLDEQIDAPITIRAFEKISPQQRAIAPPLVSLEQPVH
jgi:hypothetical protein